MTVYTVLMDFAYASILILIGQLLRAKVPLIQKFFIPSSMLAGFLGLFLGPQFLNLIHFSDSISAYTNVLMIPIFAAIGINGFKIDKKTMRNEGERVLGYGLFKAAQSALQWWLPCLLCVTVGTAIWPEINNAFGLQLASGFLGGHGTAAAVGTTLSEMGYENAGDIGMTFATVGILTGIFGGIIYIKWATAKGYTKYIKSFQYLSGDLKTGMMSPENRESAGTEPVNAMALDPLCWHLCLLLVPSGLGYLAKTAIKSQLGVNIPDYACAFIIGIVLFLILGGPKDKGLYRYVNKRTNTRISGTCTDYLVFFGVAGINTGVVVEYAVPLAAFSLLGILITWFILFVLGPAMNKDSWFERSIFVYGYATGVFAIGFLLLRIVDPDNESKTLNDTAVTTPFLTPMETFVWAAGPAMLLSGQKWTFIGIFAAVFFGCILVAMLLKWWYVKIPLSQRGTIHSIETTSADK